MNLKWVNGAALLWPSICRHFFHFYSAFLFVHSSSCLKVKQNDVKSATYRAIQFLPHQKIIPSVAALEFARDPANIDLQ